MLATTGIDVGGSSGAVVAAALRLFHADPGRRDIAGVCPDGGDRYHDTVYFPSWREQQGLPLVDLAVDVEVLTISGAPRAAEVGT
ncbi:hypothetical protein ACWGCW_25075 [Streptomyces sp. NPDC054933]